MTSTNTVQGMQVMDALAMQPNAEPPAPNAQSDAAGKAATDFESVFLGQMLGHMFEGVGEDSLSGGEQSQEIYRSWLTDQYGKLIAQSGGIGIAASVKAEMLRMQEMKGDK